MDVAPARSQWTLLAVAVVEAAVIVLLSVALLDGGSTAARAAASPRPGEAGTSAATRAVDHAAASTADHTAPRDPALTSAPPPVPRPDEAVLSGVVTTPSGELPRGTMLSLWLYRGDATKEFARTSIGWNGSSYAFPGLRAGNYRLIVQGRGFRDLEQQVEIAAGVDHVRRDLQIAPTWRLRVLIVTPDEEPMRAALAKWPAAEAAQLRVSLAAFATVDPPPSPLPLTSDRQVEFGIGNWNDANSPFLRDSGDLPARYAGTLDLAEDRQYYISVALRSQLFATERVEPRQDEVRLVVAAAALLQNRGTVRLRLVDQAGAPIAGAKVTCSELGFSPGTPTGADGRVEFTGLTAGLVQLGFAWGSEWTLATMSVAVPAGAVVDLGDIQASKPVKFTLRFAGRPADGNVAISVVRIDPLPHPALRASRLNLPNGSEDETSVELAPGRYRLLAKCGALVADATIDTAAVGTAPVLIALQQSATLRIVPPRDRVLELQLLESGGALLWRTWLRMGRPFDVPLVPGDYRAVLRGVDGTTVDRRISVSAGGAELDLR